MKEILIRVRMQGDALETLVKPHGFEADTAETSLIIIGAMQNIIRLELDKLNAVERVKISKNDN